VRWADCGCSLSLFCTICCFTWSLHIHKPCNTPRMHVSPPACFPGLCFYIFFSWLPAYLHSPAVGLPPHAALAPLLLGMVLFATAVGLTGRYICDGPAPKLWTLLGLYGVLTALAPPALLWAARGSTASLWVVLPLALGSTGGAGGMFTSIGPSLFPAGVRASGYNFSHNLAMSIFGGE